MADRTTLIILLGMMVGSVIDAPAPRETKFEYDLQSDRI